MGKIIGLDIGISSVGWAVVENDDSAKVIELGSNIFDPADASNNITRRQMRHTRRLLRRKKNRIKDFNKLWLSSGFKVNIINLNNQLELRVRGLKEKLTNEELYAVLVNLLKHRGISYLDDALDEEQKGKSDFEKGLNINRAELVDKLPCEVQLERYNSYGKYRGITIASIDNEDVSLINVLTKSAYIKEIKKLLACQMKYNDKIDDDFIEKYLKIFGRKREYYVGPGNDKSRTDYGIYTTKKDSNGKYITEDNIFEKLIGKSSIIIGDEKEEEKLRAAAASYTAEEFNVLNDLNNIVIGSRKLSKQEKIKIIEQFKIESKIELGYKSVHKIISQVTSENIDTIKGYRVDRDDNPEYHSFKTYRLLKNKLKEKGFNYDSFDRDKKDLIAHILTINTERDEIIKKLEEDVGISDSDLCELFVSIRKKYSQSFSKWHSFSLKVMNHLIPYMYDESKEQMTLITEELKDQKLKRNVLLSDNSKYINKNLVLQEIYNPVVKRSISITIDILNALIKKYKDIESIVIEMPRDKNEDDEKKRIKDNNKKNEKEYELIRNRLINDYSITDVDEKLAKFKNLSLKLKLWQEQDECCIYSGEHIDIYDLINNPDKYEIDHIIPLSISFDDSRNNKVLVKQIENQNKKNWIPYVYLHGVNREYNFDAFKNRVLQLKKDGKINKKKANNLLYDEDINKIDVLKGFISRNLNDTRYASRVILNSCQEYFKNRNLNIKVKVIRGSFTSQMRKSLSLNKDREESNAHHAIDAVIICYSQMGYEAYRKITDTYVDLKSGEIINKDILKKGITSKEYDDIMYNTKMKLRKDNIIDAQAKVKYWYKVDKKVNRQLCNQTIRGTRNIDGELYKINSFNLFTTKKQDLEKKLIVEKDKLLMYRYDRKTYDDLVLIFNRYKEQAFPFVEAKKNGEEPRKYSKNNDGPLITDIKYLDGRVGSCIDISHKFGLNKGDKRVILESLNPYRSDFYYNDKLEKCVIVGIRYNDIKCQNNKYVIDDTAYNNYLIKEGIIENNQTIVDVENNGYRFLFSLYKNNLFQFTKIDKDGKESIYLHRFLSKDSSGNAKIEVKPIDKNKYVDEHGKIKREYVFMSKAKKIKKINQNILGDTFYIENEKFKNIIDI